MIIRNAEEKDIEQILNLLSQVLEIHASIRPDIFIPQTTKYTESELSDILKNEKRRTFVATDENGKVLGYAFCEIRDFTGMNNIVPHTEMYIDDLCVDSASRGQNIGKALFNRVKDEARALGCYEITLNVWEGNDSARAFYDKIGLKPKETMMELIL
ncbi:MAG: GNAT family N-acetyltransferase [Clostridia bacterium]|nr:GNAT family N-acetyltransferase [Clostridia bacterium]